MATRSDQPPLIAIVGETASGKTGLAIELALRFNGEIIAADSRTVYKGLDIGTAKPTPEEQQAVKHHMLDIVTPDRHFSVAEFKARTEAIARDIAGRGKLVFIVGGTGLYIDSVLYDFSFRPPGDTQMRSVLESKTVYELQQILVARGIPLPHNDRNPRHLIRAIETEGQQPNCSPLSPNSLIIGLAVDRAVLRAKITARVEAMVANGLIDEVRSAARQFGWNAPGLQAPAYKAFQGYIEGASSLEEAETQFIQNDMHLAKRQRTWFRRNSDIHWICKKEESVDLITTLLNNCYTASD